MAIATGTAILAGSVLAAGGAVASGALSSKAAKKASAAQVESAQYAADLGQKQYEQTREDLTPWRTTGAAALSQLATLYGLDTSSQSINLTQGEDGTYGAMDPNDPAMLADKGYFKGSGVRGEERFNLKQEARGIRSERERAASETSQEQGSPLDSFYKSPGYQFRQDEGRKAIEKSAASKGLLRSGGTLKALERHSQGVASEEYNNYTARLMQLATGGASATVQTGQFGAAQAGQAGNAAMAAGDARASGYLRSANAWGGAMQGVGQAVGTGLGYLSYQQQPQTPGATGGAWTNPNIGPMRIGG